MVLLGEDGAKWGSGEFSAFKVNGKCWINNHAHVLKVKQSKIIDSFLTYQLNFLDLTEYVTGATVPKLNQERMKKIKISFPPISEQKQIADKLQQYTQDMIRLNEQKLKYIEELKQSTLHQAFCGKL